MNISLSPCVPENLDSRDGFSRPVPRQPAHLHTQAESGAYLRDSSRVPRRRPFFFMKPPYAIGSVPSLSGHAIAYRWRSLPRVHRHRASKPQGSSERMRTTDKQHTPHSFLAEPKSSERGPKTTFRSTLIVCVFIFSGIFGLSAKFTQPPKQVAQHI